MKVTPTPIKAANVINCCPHEITIFTGSIFDPFSGKNKGGKVILRLPASGIVATAVTAVDASPDMEVNDISIPTCTRRFAKITELPYEEGKMYIVPSLFAQAAKELGRDCSSLLVPYGTVIDGNGRTVGCTGLVRCA